MIELLEIKDFIQKIAEGITLALEIDTQIIDRYCNRIAGTVIQSLPPVGGVVRTILQTGLPHICTSPGYDSICDDCERKGKCDEKGYIHYPIFYNEQVVGVMGIICFSDEQTKKINDSRYRLFSFIEQMCSIIELKLKEYDIASRESKLLEDTLFQNQIMNQTISQLSNGYLYISKDGSIRNYNSQALRILNVSESDISHFKINDLITDPAFSSLFQQKLNTVYERIYIRKKEYGIFVSFFYNNDELIGYTVNFKTIDSFGSRIGGSPHSVLEDTIKLNDYLGESKEMQSIRNLAQKAATQPVNILISGENGTGKEMLAKAIHGSGNRNKNPFIFVNCVAFSADSIDEEIFGSSERSGHLPDSHSLGAIEMANSGTLFLNHIDQLPISVQFKLLSCIKDHYFCKKGSKRKVFSDIRIIAATDVSLPERIAKNEFLEELYYCLCGVPIVLPPLRERGNDIMLYANHFLKKYEKYFTAKSLGFENKIATYFRQYEWSGNLHEMDNVIQYMLSIHNNKTIALTVQDLPSNIRENVKSHGVPKTVHNNISSPSSISLREIENQAILDLLTEYGNTVSGKKLVAQKLGISLATLYRRLREK